MSTGNRPEEKILAGLSGILKYCNARLSIVSMINAVAAHLRISQTKSQVVLNNTMDKGRNQSRCSSGVGYKLTIASMVMMIRNKAAQGKRMGGLLMMRLKKDASVLLGESINDVVFGQYMDVAAIVFGKHSTIVFVDKMIQAVYAGIHTDKW